MSRYGGSVPPRDRSPIVRNGYDPRVLAVDCPTCGVTDGDVCHRVRRGRTTPQAIPDAHQARYDAAERTMQTRDPGRLGFRHGGHRP